MPEQDIIAHLRKLVLHQLMAQCTFSDILEEICAQTGVQSMVLDGDARLLAHSDQVRYPHRVWAEVLVEGGIPYRYFLEYPDMLKQLWLLSTSQSVAYFPMEAAQLLIAFVPIAQDRTATSGYVAVCAEVGYDRDMLTELAALIAQVYLHKTPPSHWPAVQSDRLFIIAISWGLLVSDAQSIEDLVHNSTLLSQFLPDGMRIPPLRPPYMMGALCSVAPLDREALTRLGRQLRNRIPNLFFLAMQQYILVLFVNVQPSHVRTLCDSLSSFAADYGLLCGLSVPFDGLQQRKLYKVQALDALRLGRGQSHKSRVFQVQGLHPQPLFQAAADQFGQSVLWRSDLQALVEYDQHNGTTYLETLKQYLLSAGNHTKAANQLFLDRSTLNYRLAKIRSILNCDLDDFKISLNLLIAIYIHTMAL